MSEFNSQFFEYSDVHALRLSTSCSQSRSLTVSYILPASRLAFDFFLEMSLLVLEGSCSVNNYETPT